MRVHIIGIYIKTHTPFYIRHASRQTLYGIFGGNTIHDNIIIIIIIDKCKNNNKLFETRIVQGGGSTGAHIRRMSRISKGPPRTIHRLGCHVINATRSYVLYYYYNMLDDGPPPPPPIGAERITDGLADGRINLHSKGRGETRSWHILLYGIMWYGGGGGDTVRPYTITTRIADAMCASYANARRPRPSACVIQFRHRMLMFLSCPRFVLRP